LLEPGSVVVRTRHHQHLITGEAAQCIRGSRSQDQSPHRARAHPQSAHSPQHARRARAAQAERSRSRNRSCDGKLRADHG
jgi:hypothetical protein